jgi:hypothetical protein
MRSGPSAGARGREEEEEGEEEEVGEEEVATEEDDVETEAMDALHGCRHDGAPMSLHGWSLVLASSVGGEIMAGVTRRRRGGCGGVVGGGRLVACSSRGLWGSSCRRGRLGWRLLSRALPVGFAMSGG